MKRLARLLALVLTLALVAAACGGDDETDSGADTDAVTADDATDDAMEDEESDSDAMEDEESDDDAMEDEESHSADDDAMEDDDTMEDDESMEDDDTMEDDAMEDEESDDDAMEEEGAAGALLGLAISSIDFDTEEVVIVNNSDSEVELDGFFLCSFPDYAKIEGAGTVAPGESLTIVSPVGLSAAAGELGLYTTDSYSDPNAIQAYVEWGTPDHERAPVAIEAGIYDGTPLTVDGNTLVAG